eukprot:1458523-Pyramimonas_sp.AAC.2
MFSLDARDWLAARVCSPSMRAIGSRSGYILEYRMWPVVQHIAVDERTDPGHAAIARVEGEILPGILLVQRRQQ